VLLHLSVLELKNLQAVWEGRLSSLGFCEVVDDLLGGVRLLDVLVVEEDDGIAVRPALSLDSIRKHNLFLPTRERALSLAISSNCLVFDLLICS